LVFSCGNCGFLFERADMPENCPNYSKEYILPAKDEEKLEFQKLKTGLSE